MRYRNRETTVTTFYQPMQREDNKRWDMTSRSGSTKPHPIGYCRGWTDKNPWPGDTEFDRSMSRTWKDHQAKLLPHRTKFHDGGHETAREAMTCWLDYRLDMNLRFSEDPEAKKLCVAEGCGEWTHGRADLTGSISAGPPAALCEEHQTREHYRAHLVPREVGG